MEYDALFKETTIITFLLVVSLMGFYLMWRKSDIDDSTKKMGIAFLVIGLAVTGYFMVESYSRAVAGHALGYAYKMSIESGKGDLAETYYSSNPEIREKIDNLMQSTDINLGKIGVSYGFHRENGIIESTKLYVACLFHTWFKSIVVPLILILMGVGFGYTLEKSYNRVVSDYKAKKKENEKLDKLIPSKTAKCQWLIKTIQDIESGKYKNEIKHSASLQHTIRVQEEQIREQNLQISKNEETLKDQESKIASNAVLHKKRIKELNETTKILDKKRSILEEYEEKVKYIAEHEVAINSDITESVNKEKKIKIQKTDMSKMLGVDMEV